MIQMKRVINVLKTLALCELFLGCCMGRSCIDRTQTSAAPKGLKEVPVVLTMAELNSDVQLPCHYCDETVGITGRIWRRRNLNGEEEEVQLDLHDDRSKNRVFVDKDHNLIVRRVSEKDGAYYYCYGTENTTKPNSMKLDILLDVGYRSTLEPYVVELPADLGKEISKHMKSCNKIKSIASLSMYSCYAEWAPWGKCDVCGKVGKRKRLGECRLQKFSQAELEMSEGKKKKVDFPIVGVGCHSFLLDAIPTAKKILSQIPNIILQEKCEISCENYMKAATEMTAYKKSSYLKKIKVKMLKAMKGVKQTITAEEKQEHEGESITFFCPGTNLDIRVKWKFQSRALNPEKIKQKTSGRVTIDAMDTLHIKELRITDSGEYICSLFGAEIGLVRLKVISKYTVFDPASNFGILTIVMVLSFILWIILVTMKWKSFKLQHEVQKMRAKKKTLYKDVHGMEIQSLLTEN